MKTLAFVIGLCIIAVGAVGILTPSGLIWIVSFAKTVSASLGERPRCSDRRQEAEDS